MSKAVKIGLILPVVLIGYALTLKKPASLTRPGTPGTDVPAKQVVPPPLVVYTSLSDTLTPEALRSLGIDDVTGIKLKSINGLYACYFQYHAEAKKLLDTFAGLPFHRSAVVADTVCRKVPFYAFESWRKNITAAELQSAPDFWFASPEEFEVYECIKPPMRHQILISKTDNRVMHRAEPVV